MTIGELIAQLQELPPEDTIEVQTWDEWGHSYWDIDGIKMSADASYYIKLV